MRLFVAVPLPAAIAAEAASVLPEHPGLRPVAPELMHVTLAFLGRVPVERLPEVVDAARGASDASPFALTLQGVGRFPSSGAPRVAWIGMGEGATEMAALADALRRDLAARDLPFDAKPFRAHVTLARVRENVARDDLRAIRTIIEGARLRPLRFTVDALTVMESALSSKGPRYTSRASVALVPVVGRKA